MYSIKEDITNDGIPYVHVENIPRLSIFKTFDCGQCFRFDPVEAEGGITYEGVAFGKYVDLPKPCNEFCQMADHLIHGKISIGKFLFHG